MLLTRLNPHPVGHLQGRLIPTRGAFWFLCVVSHTRRAPRERRAPNARHRASAACRSRDMADETTQLLRIVSRALHHMFVRELKRSIEASGLPGSRLPHWEVAGRETAQGRSPSLAQLGICSVAPLPPHLEQAARWCSMSLDAFGPHRTIAGANAVGALCRHSRRRHFTHSQHWCLRSWARVGGAGSCSRRVAQGYADGRRCEAASGRRPAWSTHTTFGPCSHGRAGACR